MFIMFITLCSSHIGTYYYNVFNLNININHFLQYIKIPFYDNIVSLVKSEWFDNNKKLIFCVDCRSIC